MRLKPIAFTLTAFTVGIVFASVTLQTGTPPPAPRPPYFDNRVLSGEPPLPIPPLSEIIGDADTDEHALSAISSYYNRQSLRLAVLFREDNDERTRALFGMYIVHLAAPYNIVTRAWEGESFLAFVHGETAHCGAYAQAQRAVYSALGLRWRSVLVDNGWHEVVEAEIDGRYEVFDSTSAVWINQPVEGLLRGVERQYRMFYSPIMDASADDAYRDHLQRGYSVPELRAGLPWWGLYVFPRRIEVIAESA